MPSPIFLSQEVAGHDSIVQRFETALAAGRLASAYLFVGPAGIGKRRLAEWLAQAFLCQSQEGPRLMPCGQCESCRLFAAGTHPDVLRVEKPAGRSEIPVELLIGDREHRLRAGLCHDIGLKPFLAERRIAILDDADDLNQEGANALLKTLEEPPPGAVLILIGTSAALQLPTIRSRCQIVRFQPLPTSLLADILVRIGAVPDQETALRLAPLSGGSVARALELADPAVVEFRHQLLAAFSQPLVDSWRLSQTIGENVEQAGREATQRRARLRQILSVAVEFYRGLMLAGCGAPLNCDPVLDEAVQRRLPHSSQNPEAAADCLQRSLEALEQVDRNANQSTLIECWLDDLERRLAA